MDFAPKRLRSSLDDEDQAAARHMDTGKRVWIFSTETDGVFQSDDYRVI